MTHRHAPACFLRNLSRHLTEVADRLADEQDAMEGRADDDTIYSLSRVLAILSLASDECGRLAEHEGEERPEMRCSEGEQADVPTEGAN